jgi:hypothetical protein
VANHIQALELSNVQIVNATEADGFSQVVISRLARGPDALQANSKLSALASSGLLLEYNLVFIAQRVVISSSDPNQAYVLAATQLIAAVDSGVFTTTLQSTAAEQNSPAFLTSTTEVAVLAIDSNFAVTVVHSSIPTSQPSTQPSGEPSSQPSSLPTAQPFSHPSSRPTGQPSSQPSSVPTLTMETKWIKVLEGIASYVAPSIRSDRTSYYAMDVSGENLYGSCESWNAYILASLWTTRKAKALDRLELTVQAAESNALPTVYTCTDATAVVLIVDQLVANSPGHSTGATSAIPCGDVNWVVEDCRVGPEAAYSMTSAGQTFSRAVCVGCTSPCAEYDCSSASGSAVLSPCTHKKTCPYLKGSLRILTTHYHDTNGTEGTYFGYISFGCAWGVIITLTLLYNTLIMRGLDWLFLRGLPSPTVGGPESAHPSSRKMVAPEPSGHTKDSGLSVDEQVEQIYSAVTGSRALADRVTALMDRVQIAAGKHKLAHPDGDLPLMQTFWYRIVSYNHYLTQFSRCTQSERFACCLDVLTRISWLYFLVALCLYYNYPDDDNSCYSKSTAEECNARATLFDPNQSYCSWVGLTGPDSALHDGNQPVHQTQCLWPLYTGSAIVSLHVILVSIFAASVIKSFYTNFLLNCVLLSLPRMTDVHPAPAGGAASSTRAKYTPRKVAPDEPHANKASSNLKSISAPAKEARQNPTGVYKVILVLLCGAELDSTSADADASDDPADDLYQAFVTNFVHCRYAVQRDSASEQVFNREWMAACPFLHSVTSDVIELRKDAMLRGNTGGVLAKQRIISELLSVRNTAAMLSQQYAIACCGNEEMLSVRVLIVFLCDLLGKDSIQCRLIQVMLRDLLQDSAPFRDVRNWLKFCVIMFFIATNICLVYGSVMLLQHFAERRQWYWVITAVLAVLVDMVVVENVEALWFQWALPQCVADTLHALRRTFLVIVRKFQHAIVAELRRPQSASFSARTAPSQSQRNSEGASEETRLAAFSMPDYQFVSSNLVKSLPENSLARRIVGSYQTDLPKTITLQRWPYRESATFSSGLGFESLGYVFFGNVAMVAAVNWPASLQQITLTGLVSMGIYLLSAMIRSASTGNLLGVYVMLATLVAIYLAVKSFEVAWSSDKVAYTAGVQSLYPEDVARGHSDASARAATPGTVLSGKGPSSPSELRIASPLNAPMGSGPPPRRILTQPRARSSVFPSQSALDLTPVVPQEPQSAPAFVPTRPSSATTPRGTHKVRQLYDDLSSSSSEDEMK